MSAVFFPPTKACRGRNSRAAPPRRGYTCSSTKVRTPGSHTCATDIFNVDEITECQASFVLQELTRLLKGYRDGTITPTAFFSQYVDLLRAANNQLLKPMVRAAPVKVAKRAKVVHVRKAAVVISDSETDDGL